MEVVETIAAAREALAGSKHPVGLVPTMGYLHEGHLSLVRLARAGNRTVAVSIFVNPTQFGPGEDFTVYPRDMDRDLRLLRDEGVDLVFSPSADEMYPDGFKTYVTVERITDKLEGSFRPIHFRGVATIVLKLFTILEPDRAYFGQKDAQQLRVIQQLVTDLNVPVEVHAGPTVREADGLALSSRNVLLSAEERTAATVLSRSLRLAEERYRQGERSGTRLREVMRAELAGEPLARPDYVSVADADSLDELESIDGPALLSVAVRIGQTRLIDNIPLH